MKKDAADARKAKKKAIPLRVERIAEKSGDKQVFVFAGMQIIVKGQDILRGMRAFPHKGKSQKMKKCKEKHAFCETVLSSEY